MRTNEFTFKKTKRIVKKYHGISVDLTVQEATDLVEILKCIEDHPDDDFFGPLRFKLQDFVLKQLNPPKPRFSFVSVG